ncbi:MAG: TadE family protein [Acidimicrobiia bacterium]
MRSLLLRRSKSEDKGAAVIEFSIVFALLLTIALGAFEYGMAFRDWLSVSVSTREGARVAASAATYGSADCVILEATAGALQSLNSGELDEVHIYRSDANGSYPGAGSSYNRRYRPGVSGEPGLIACGGGSLWYPISLGSNWDPGDRNNSGTSADWIGVRVVFDHDWLTDFLWWSGTVTYIDDAVFRMEPPAP